MSKFFINRPIVAMVIAIVTVIVGAVTITGLPVAQFPNIAPGNSGTRHLCWRGRADTRTVGCHSHRAANERSGQHELHVLVECDGKLANHSDHKFRCENGPQHRSDPRPVKGDPGSISASHRRYQLWNHRQKISDRPADAGRGVFPAWYL